MIELASCVSPALQADSLHWARGDAPLSPVECGKWDTMHAISLSLRKAWWRLLLYLGIPEVPCKRSSYLIRETKWTGDMERPRGEALRWHMKRERPNVTPSESNLQAFLPKETSSLSPQLTVAQAMSLGAELPGWTQPARRIVGDTQKAWCEASMFKGTCSAMINSYNFSHIFKMRRGDKITVFQILFSLRLLI